MPFGVSRDFLNLAKQQQRRALVATAPLVAAGLAGGVVAELLDPPRVGAFVYVYAGAILAGLVLGGLGGWWEVRSWAKSLRDGWTEWMNAAVGAGSMGETASRAGARHVTIGGAMVAVLVVLNGSALAAAWFRLPPLDLLDPYGVFAFATVVATGVVIGARAAINVAEAWWCREVEAQTRDLIESGRVGVWGYR